MCVNDRRGLAVRVEAEGCCRRWGAVGKAALFLVWVVPGAGELNAASLQQGERGNTS